ncbi:MAG: DUF1761 domain-containing protein [Gemmatimonadaceae bacterium]
MHYPPVNYLAVLVSGIVIFLLGGLWYSPVLFAKRWIALQGRTEEQMKADAARANMPVMYLSAFITGLVISAALAIIFVHIAPSVDLTAAHGAMFGFICWLGFAATTSYATALFSMRSREVWVIDTTYNLVSFVLAGIILAVWR